MCRFVQKLQNPANLCLELDKRVEKAVDDPTFAWAHSSWCSLHLGLILDYIVSLFEHKKAADISQPLPTSDAFKKAYKNYKKFFLKVSLFLSFSGMLGAAKSHQALSIMPSKKLQFCTWIGNY